MLEIRNLHTHYDRSHIIQGIDLSVAAGEVFGIFGRNGVGKTTLLKTIAGWVKPTGGEIEFDGQRIDGQPAHRIARSGAGFVPEDRRIFPGLSVEENLTSASFRCPAGPAPETATRWLKSTSAFRAWPNVTASLAPHCRAANSKCWQWRG